MGECHKTASSCPGLVWWLPGQTPVHSATNPTCRSRSSFCQHPGASRGRSNVASSPYPLPSCYCCCSACATAVTGKSLATALGINGAVCIVAFIIFSILRVKPFTRRFYAPKRCDTARDPSTAHAPCKGRSGYQAAPQAASSSTSATGPCWRTLCHATPPHH